MAYRHISRKLDVDVEGGLTLIATRATARTRRLVPDVPCAGARNLDRSLVVAGRCGAVQPVQSDPVRGIPADNPGIKTRRQHALRLSPVLEHEFTARNAVLLRHDMPTASTHPTLDDARLHARQTTGAPVAQAAAVGRRLEWSGRKVTRTAKT